MLFFQILGRLGTKSSFLGAPWPPAGIKMVPKLDQVAPKCSQKASTKHVQSATWDRFASKVAFGMLWGTILADIGPTLGIKITDVRMIFQYMVVRF